MQRGGCQYATPQTVQQYTECVTDGTAWSPRPPERGLKPLARRTDDRRVRWETTGPFRLLLVATVGLALVGAGAPGCAKAPAATSTSRRAKPKAKPKSRRAEDVAALAAPSMLELESSVPDPAGDLVRVYRRPITHGVIAVHDERVPGERAANERRAELLAEGWRLWPPSASPELAAALADAHPELVDCPFLFRVSQLPDNLLVEPRRHVTCFRTLAGLEEALEREAVIRYHQGQATPCGELRVMSTRERRSPGVRELQERCEAMGILIAPAPDTLGYELEISTRSKRNRTFTRRISQ